MPKRLECKLSPEEASNIVSDLIRDIGKSIFGQDPLITEAVSCFLAGGHLLMTGAPGLAKTSLIRVIGLHLGLKFGRVQFTPDLLPSDITGSDVLDMEPVSGQRKFRFSPGPVFTNLLLADEINRASPRTQSALLEAMQEHTCTIGGNIHQIQEPFMVFATQNPYESEGTFPLPEAQLDRFLAHSLVTYPAIDAEVKILREHAENNLIGERKSGIQDILEERTNLGPEVVGDLMKRTRMVPIEDELIKIISELVRSTRIEDETCPLDIRDWIWYGASPRAGISLVSMSKALALITKSEVVRWSHVKQMALPVLRHRIRLSAHASRDRISEDKLILELIGRLEDKHRFLAKGIG